MHDDLAYYFLVESAGIILVRNDLKVVIASMYNDRCIVTQLSITCLMTHPKKSEIFHSVICGETPQV